MAGGGLLGGVALLYGRVKEWTATNSATAAVAGVAAAALVAGGLAVGVAGLGGDEGSAPPAAVRQPEDGAAAEEAPSAPDEEPEDSPPAEQPPAGPPAEDPPPATTDDAPPAEEPAAPANSPPQLQAPVIKVDAPDGNGPVTIDVVQGATDRDGDPLWVDSARLSDPADGAVMVGSPAAGGGARTMVGQAPAREGRPQTVTFIPEAGTRGTVTIVYDLTDGSDSVTGRVEVRVPNTPPHAKPDRAEVDAWAVGRPTSVRIPVLANDSDPDRDRLRLADELVEGPRKGDVERRGDAFVYTPDRARAGRDTFRYRVTDGHGDSAVALVRVDLVRPALLAVDDHVTTEFEKKVRIDVLANDTHVGGEITGVTVLRGTGTATVEGDRVSFHPDADFAGEARLRYTVTDVFGRTATATVRVTVECEDDEEKGTTTRTTGVGNGNDRRGPENRGHGHGLDPPGRG